MIRFRGGMMVFWAFPSSLWSSGRAIRYIPAVAGDAAAIPNAGRRRYY